MEGRTTFREGTLIRTNMVNILTMSQNFRCFQTERVLQTTTLNLMKMVQSSPNGWKTQWEKEKLLITSNISFSQCFEKACTADTWKPGLTWERVNPFPHNDTFWRPRETSLLKTLLEKEKLLITSNFSFSHSVFYPFG